MTIATTNSRKDYVGNSSTPTYAFDFKIFVNTDLEVYRASILLALTTDYTVALDGAAPSTGTITLVAGNLGTGVPLAIVRNVTATQGVNLVANDSFPAETIESELDRLTMLAQQNEEAGGRALKLKISSTQLDRYVDDLVAGKFLRVKTPATDGIEMSDILTSGSLGIPVAITDGGTGQITADGGLAALQAVEDARTNTVKAKVYKATTSGTPAAGIGAGEKFQAESTDENPSDVGEHQFVFSDVGPGTEDSYWQLLLRVAGAALTAVYRFVATGAFKAIFTHANTADRTYTLPDRTGTVVVGSATRQVFTASGTWTKPAGVLAVMVRVIGGGGGGGGADAATGASGGGGAGGYAEKWSTTPGATETITIGAAGAAGSTGGGNGGAGGTSAFGAGLSATGGAGGGGTSGGTVSAQGGLGGTAASTGDVPTATAMPGMPGFSSAASGTGGSGQFGGGGVGLIADNNGNAATGRGAGGSGARGGTAAGGAGTAGLIIVDEYY